jgi:hypothetical protein
MKKGLIAALLLASGLAVASSVTCPIDNMGMHFTGNTRVEMGKMLYEYKCPSGHRTWVVQ